MDSVAIGAIIALVLTIVVVTFLGFKISYLMKNTHSEN